MTKKTYIGDPSILEAVDHLSSMAEIEVEEVKEAQKELVEDKIRVNVIRWLDPLNSEKTLTSAKSTFKAVHKYLQHVYTKESKALKDVDMQRGVRSIISLANEAAAKLDECRALVGERGSVTDTKEYRELIEFYEKKILKRFEKVIKEEEEWENEWKGEEDAADIQRRGLKDLESVTRDRNYELFHLTKEDGARFYNRNLIRHIRLVADFDQLVSTVSGDDPLLRVRVVQDEQAQKTAKGIYNALEKDLNRWFQRTGKYRDDPFIQLFFRAIMSLLLAANRYNTISHTASKPCVSYFADFQWYLRHTLHNVDYLSFIENPSEEIDVFYDFTIDLIHKACYALYTHREDWEEGLSFLTRIVGRDRKEASQKSHHSSLAVWNEVLDEYEHLHAELNKYPSGPLFKVLDIIHEGSPGDFDPFLNEDRPKKNYSLHFGKNHIEVLSMACPTRQRFIHKAEVIPEFHGFLRHLKKTSQKVLVINFQERTSWKEFARCEALEKLHVKAEFRFEIDVVTLPKETDFYHQADPYLKLDNSDEFKENLFQQLQSEEECGFHFPKYFKRDQLFDFARQAIEMIHKLFFGQKKRLSRKNRLDFIEIFYHLLVIKFLLVSQASHLIFCAKDGVDQAAIANGTFFALSKVLGGFSEWKEEEKEMLTALLFVPALLVRERSVDLKMLNRAVSMLANVSAELEVSRNKVQKAFNKLLGVSFCEKLSVQRT